MKLYLRAWERHKVYFGVSCAKQTVRQYGKLFSTTHTTFNGTESADNHPILPSHQLTVAVSSACLHYRFPYNYADGSKRGMLNPAFLNASTLLNGDVFTFIVRLNSPVAMVLFSLPHIYRTEHLSADELFGMLACFLDTLPSSHRYAMHINNPEFLLPAYFDCLRQRNATHVLSDMPPMPPVLDQVLLPHAFTSDVVVVHTSAGLHAEWQLGIIETVRRCVDEKKRLYVYVGADDGWENVVVRLEELMKLLNGDLARLSPIKRKAA